MEYFVSSTVEYGDELKRDAKKLAGASDQAKFFIEVFGPERISDISVVSYRAVEKMGQSYRIDIVAACPRKLTRDVILGHEAKFRLVPDDGGEPVVYWGRITGFSHTKTTNDLNSYEIVLKAHIGCLNPHTTQTYQNSSAPEIIDAVLRRNELKGHQFIFKLRRQYPRHPFRFQYQQGDWDFVNMLMQQEGMYSYIIQGEHGDVVIFGDDIDHYVYQPKLASLHRPISGLMTGEESVSALRMDTEMVPMAYVVADYNPDQAWERIKAEANVARSDKTTYGQPYLYGTGHLDQSGAQWEAQLRHEAALAWQVVYTGESNLRQLRPGRILTTDENFPDAPHGQVIIEITHSGGRAQPYRNTYKAIPSDRRFRLKIEDHKWPKITGTLSARVTSPGKYKYAYLTQQGYYVVRFDCDYGEWPAGGESVPLRLAKPFAGGLQTGFHFPVVEGTEAVIEFRDGNPNKPYISAFHHTNHQVDLITNQDRLMSRNRIYTQSGNEFDLEDWEGEEHVRLSTEHSGKSQLTLGHIVNGKRQHRGSGFELRTDQHGVLRAGGGLMLCSDMQPQADGKQTDMAEAMTQFQTLQIQAQSLADQANTAKAEIADLKAENEWLKNSVNELKEAVVLLSSPKGVAVLTSDRVSVSAGKDVNVTTGSGFNVSALKSIVMAAESALSLFAHTLGIKMLAARGKVQIQAQSDELAMSALKDLTITSTNGRLVLSAKEEVWIGAGGSYLRITPCNITNATPGDYIEKAVSWQRNSPDSQLRKESLPYTTDLPDTGAHGSRFSG
ncbi:type VI secretion system tip protein VgrG [Paraburkholderia sp. SEWSISQ10-3 4]|uniref:type VI secretion system Vgr family protein n=1 Tax=Paraburkholderia TaxID=1822464 RepID=UPI00225B5920|nr:MULTISPECIES: type VI secretion system Vgr family protein [Paraburkholderia]MCX4138477.1 type VI secretion system tip protein VgrG [Paraburkholderia aspalathi]MDN7171167.1 type VI secretion system tip protein VgrG [Paraburkholderia sp. SEWSISQ10-3 4]MDQ6500806.1 type VI secretion system tip protein VgrG [Paraburkholderia aspalathi]